MARARKAAAAAVPAAPAGDVLVTGFEPFGGEGVNPSWEICEGLAAAIGHARLHTRLVPTEFRRAIEVVAAAIEETEPALVILLGQAGGRAALSVERVAINVDDARIADNAGRQPVDEPVAAIREEGIPAEVSNSAGTFVCNHLLYGVLHFLAASGRPARAGFIHVPWLESQAVTRPGEPAMALATMVRGVEAAIAAALATPVDVKMAAGSLD